MDDEYRVAVFTCFWALGSPSVGLEDHLNADENKGWRLHSFCPREIGTVHGTARVEYTVVWERPKDPPLIKRCRLIDAAPYGEGPKPVTRTEDKPQER